MRYAENAMVKAAYNSISTGLGTENPRAPPMTDFATQTARAPKKGWPERSYLGKDRIGSNHSVLVVDLDVRSLLGVGADAKKAAPTKRRAAIKYSDKKRVERFREYATDEFVKRNLDGALTELIGGITFLDAALRDRGRTERELDEGAPWEALRWQRRWDPSADDGTLR